MKVGLLECDHVLEKYRHIAGDYREMFAALMERHAPQLNLLPFDVRNGEFPPSLETCDAYLCTGSRFSVYDDADWIHSLKDFVRRLRNAERPFIGICFGHQMMAEALGGKVEKSPQGWGVGVHAVEILRREAWMQPSCIGAQAQCNLQYMHQDQVMRLPEGGVLLGGSEHCPVAMFRAGPSMLGIQAHPEFPAAYSEALMLDRVERIGAERVEAGRRSLEQKTDEGTIVQWIAEFLSSQTSRQID